MSISGIGSKTSLTVQSLVDLRRQLDDLQRQLSTGQKSDTYAGVGLERGLAVGLRSHLAALNAFDDTISNVGVRLDLVQQTLTRFSDIAHTVKGAAYQPTSIDSSGSTAAQQSAYSSLSEILGLLNTQAGGRYLFSGRSTDAPAVETIDHIMNGDGTRAGLKQIIAERNQADLGADGLGRLIISAPGMTSVKLAEDAVSPFGFKLAGVTSTLDRRNRHAVRPAGGVHGRPRQRQPRRRRYHPVPLHAPRRIKREHHTHGDDFRNPGREPVHHRRYQRCDRRQSAGGAHDRGRQACRDLAFGGVRHRGRRTISSTSMPAIRRNALPAHRSILRQPWSRARPPTRSPGTPASSAAIPPAPAPPPASIRRSPCPMERARTRRASAGLSRTWPCWRR